MKRLKCIKEKLMECVENEMTHLESVDTHELGEAIDMIKDLEEAMYYHSIVAAMNEEKTYSTSISDYEEKSHHHRKMYMESHDLNKGKEIQMRELEAYIQELSSDIMEMIKKATPEEKILLQQKMIALANKIQ